MCQNGGGGSFLRVWSLCFLVRVLPLCGSGPGSPWAAISSPSTWGSRDGLGGGWRGVSFSLWVVLQQGLIHVLGSPRHLPWESSTTHPGNPRDASCSQAGGALGSLSGQQPQSKSEQVKNTNQEEGRPQAVLTQWATREPGLKQGHTRADLSGLDGRPHRWVSHPRFVVPLAHPCLCLAPSPWSGSWPRD